MGVHFLSGTLINFVFENNHFITAKKLQCPRKKLFYLLPIELLTNQGFSNTGINGSSR